MNAPRYAFTPKWTEPERKTRGKTSIGHLDAEGRLEGAVPAAGRVTLELSAAGGSIAFPTPVHDVALAVELGELALELPGLASVPEGAGA